MTKYVSNRQKDLRVGITSYSENLTSLQVVGKVGIGTTNARTDLEVNGHLGFTNNNILIGDEDTGKNLTPGTPFSFSGNNNIFLGKGAGYSTTDGRYNNFFGYQSGYNNFGSSNTFIGHFSGFYNSLGTFNTFIGENSGYYNTNGVFNTFFGLSAGVFNTVGSYNNFLGTYAGYSNRTGSYNNFVGSYIGISTSASYKLLFGSGTSNSSLFDSPDTTKNKQFAIGLNTTGTSEYWLVGNENFNIGIGTTNPTSKLYVDGDTYITGILTANRIISSVYGEFTGGSISGTNIVGTALSISGISTFSNGPVFIGSGTSTGTLDQKLQVTGGAYFSSSVGIGTTNPTSKLWVSGDGYFTGVVTSSNFYVGNSLVGSGGSFAQIYVSGITTSIGGFVGNLTGIAASATQLVTPKTFEITGDVVASAISFDGTGNVSLAATIQPNSVELGTDTFGDYVQSISGTSNQITVTGGTSEGSTPTLSLPTNLIIPQDLTVTRDLQVNRNLNVNGNITIGGTSAFIYATELTVSDPDIILGFRTDLFGNDISTDNTANHGGIAIASTEGSPLVQIYNPGIGESTLPTYKKIMWFKEGTFAGLGTDAWLINYAVGIGSTQFPSGTRLAAGLVQFTENDLAVVRNINASGIVTIGTVEISSGIISATSGIVTYYGDGSHLTGVNAFNVIQQDITSQVVYPTLANATGVSSIGISTNQLVFNPSTGSLGIGTTNPTTKLQVGGVLGFGPGNNVRIGDNTTGANLTGGYNNIFMGVGAGNSNTIGIYNNFIGYQAGYYNTNGDFNTFLGLQAGFYNNSGTSNNFFGFTAGFYNTSGSSNNFFGNSAGYSNITGGSNNFLGRDAGLSNTTGNVNNFLGARAGYENTTGNNNLFLGSYSGISTSASKKVILGSGFSFTNLFDSPNTTKDTQFAVGVRTDANPSKYWLVGNENFNVGIGTTNPTTKLQVGGVLGFGTFYSGGAIPSTNIRIGDNTTGANLTPGSPFVYSATDNIFMGIGAGSSTTSGSNNNFIGWIAGYYNTTGYDNNFIGASAGYGNTTGRRNNFIGAYSGYENTSGSYNNFFGRLSGYYNTTGFDNNFFGEGSGKDNTTGNRNTFLGSFAGENNTTGSDNFFGGSISANYNITGSSNIYLGVNNGISTSASYKVIIGSGYLTNYFDSPDTTKDTQFAIGVRTDANPSKYWLVGNENFNVGIGTTNPQTKLEIDGVLGFTQTNVRIGNVSTGSSTTGIYNNFIGWGAGEYSTSGANYNNFIGANAGEYNTSGYHNAFVGQGAGNFNTTGYYNNFFGNFSGGYNTTGNDNTSIGKWAGQYNTTGSFNVFLGSNTGISTSASRKVIFGSGTSSNIFDSPDTTKDTQFAVGVRTDANPSKYWLVGNENFNVGIGTTNPTVRLQIDGVLGFGTFLAAGTSATNIKIGNENTATSLTTGHSNVFMGSGVGKYTTEGTYNNFLGAYAGYCNTTGGQNNFFGDNAGYYNTTSQRNNFIGSGAGYQNTTGSFNNFIGYYAGELNTTGDFSNIIGAFAGHYNTTGIRNNFFGAEAGIYNTIGNNNIFFGNSTGLSTSASNKVIIGSGWQWSPTGLFDAPDTNKDTQFAVGVRTDANPSKYWLVGNENFNIGIGTTNPTVRLQIDGVLGFGTFYDGYGYSTVTNIRIGDNTTGANLTGGYNNIFMGIGAGNSNTTGYSNNFLGSKAGYANTTGCFNNFLGHYAGYSNADGSQNNFFGGYAGHYNTTGNFNNFIGYRSGEYNESGSLNNFFGYDAGQGNTTGERNNFFGLNAGRFNQSGSRNVFIGDGPGYQNTTGTDNIFLGSGVGQYNTTGNINIFLGSFTGISETASRKVIFGSGTAAYFFDSPDTTKDTQFAVGVRTDANPSKYWLVGNENFNVGIGTTNPTTKLTVGGDISNSHTTYGSATSSASTLSSVGIHSALPVATYRSVEYFIQATTGSRYQAVKLLSVHDGSASYNTTYGDIFSNGSIASFDVDISGGNVRLVATASTDSQVSYIVNYTANRI